MANKNKNRDDVLKKMDLNFDASDNKKKKNINSEETDELINEIFFKKNKSTENNKLKNHYNSNFGNSGDGRKIYVKPSKVKTTEANLNFQNLSNNNRNQNYVGNPNYYYQHPIPQNNPYQNYGNYQHFYYSQYPNNTAQNQRQNFQKKVVTTTNQHTLNINDNIKATKSQKTVTEEMSYSNKPFSAGVNKTIEFVLPFETLDQTKKKIVKIKTQRAKEVHSLFLTIFWGVIFLLAIAFGINSIYTFIDQFISFIKHIGAENPDDWKVTTEFFKTLYCSLEAFLFIFFLIVSAKMMISKSKPYRKRRAELEPEKSRKKLNKINEKNQHLKDRAQFLGIRYKVFKFKGTTNKEYFVFLKKQGKEIEKKIKLAIHRNPRLKDKEINIPAVRSFSRDEANKKFSEIEKMNQSREEENFNKKKNIVDPMDDLE